MNDERQKLFYLWEDMTFEERKSKRLPLTLSAEARKLKVANKTLYNWRKQRDGSEVEEEEDEDDIAVVKKRLFHQTKANPQASKVYLDKYAPQEIIGREIPADDFIKAGQQLIEQLRNRIPSECIGKCPLFYESTPFYAGARVDSGQEHGEEDQVAAVALPSGLTDNS